MKCDKKDLLLYAVTDRSWLNGETLYSQVEKALEGGATLYSFVRNISITMLFFRRQRKSRNCVQNIRYRLCWTMMWSLHWKLARTEFM